MSRSGDILFVAEPRRGSLREISAELASAGRVLAELTGGRLTGLVVAADAARLADGVDLPGVDELLILDSPAANFEAHATEQALVSVIEERAPAVVLLGHTVDGMGVAPAVAARCGTGFASDVTALSWDGELVVERGAYGDKLVARQRLGADRTAVVMVRPGSFPAAAGNGAARRVERAGPPPGSVRTEHVEFRDAPTGDVDITQAEVLLAIGRGVSDREEIPRYEELADRLGATLTASRPLVDAGWLESSRQVGQSGKVVKPRVYLALGISGAVQHLAGMRESGTVIAVNIDPDAPIFAAADYGAVADIQDVAAALSVRLA